MRRSAVKDKISSPVVTQDQIDSARRNFLSVSALFAATTVIKAQEKKS